jgi:hypothetical protein
MKEGGSGETVFHVRLVSPGENLDQRLVAVQTVSIAGLKR